MNFFIYITLHLAYLLLFFLSLFLCNFRRRGQLRNQQEDFNHAYSSIRNVIERSFGVWKQR